VYTLRALLADVWAVLRHSPRLLAIYGRARVDPAVRERVMVAVSRSNACSVCTRVHEAWALRAGASPTELEQIGAGDLAGLPADEQAAIVYATALVESRFAGVGEDARALADARLDPERQLDIEAIARLVTLHNRSLMTVRTFVARAAVRRGVSARVNDQVPGSIPAPHGGLPLAVDCHAGGAGDELRGGQTR